MSDLIDRKIAIQGIRELFQLGECYCDEFSIVGMLNGLPSAEPERKTGRWILLDGYRCSVCNHKLQSTGIPTFCPSCGADMRGKENG